MKVPIKHDVRVPDTRSRLKPAFGNSQFSSSHLLQRWAEHTIFEAFVRGLQEHAMCWIHGLGLLGCDAKERCIEHLVVLLEEVCMSVVMQN